MGINEDARQCTSDHVYSAAEYLLRITLKTEDGAPSPVLLHVLMALTVRSRTHDALLLARAGLHNTAEALLYESSPNGVARAVQQDFEQRNSAQRPLK